MIKIFNFIGILTLLVVGYLILASANAQTTPEILLSWRATGYVPSSYSGKILPVPGASVAVSFELIDRGVIANISQNEVRWSVDNQVQASGQGLKRFSFAIGELERSDKILTVSVLNYRGAVVEKTITIPVAASEVVIKKTGSLFEALPYFFNVSYASQLSYRWTVNNANPTGLAASPWLLSLDTSNLPDGYEINASIEVSSLLNRLENASSLLNFIK